MDSQRITIRILHEIQQMLLSQKFVFFKFWCGKLLLVDIDYWLHPSEPEDNSGLYDVLPDYRKEANTGQIPWEPVSYRSVKACSKSSFHNLIMTAVYSPTNVADSITNDGLCDALRKVKLIASPDETNVLLQEAGTRLGL